MADHPVATQVHAMERDRPAEVHLQGGLHLVKIAGAAYPEDGVSQSQTTKASRALGGRMRADVDEGLLHVSALAARCTRGGLLDEGGKRTTGQP